MGVVYLAQDPRLDRQVAIKVLPPDLTRDATAKQRFLQEAQAASALDHPNICTILEINETADGQLYLVMAHYEGETLNERIARRPWAGPTGALDSDELIIREIDVLNKPHFADWLAYYAVGHPAFIAGVTRLPGKDEDIPHVLPIGRSHAN